MNLFFDCRRPTLLSELSTLSDNIMEKLEQITNEAKSRMQELALTDYSKVA